jgi:hypothetical protein
MTNKSPKITALKPIVMPDKRRVSLEMVVDNLPTTFSKVMLMPDLFEGGQAAPPKKVDRNAPSPYPNVELSILNSERRQVARLFIVEHKEANIDLTLHLRSANPADSYIARAEMTYNDEVLDVVEVPFRLNE